MMTVKKRLLYAVLLFLPSWLFSWQAYEFCDVGTKAAGLGTAFSAEADDLSALYWNPAALIRQDRLTVEGQFNLLSFSLGTLAKTRRVTLNYIPTLLAVSVPSQGPLYLTVGQYSPFIRNTQSDYSVHGVGPALAWRITPSLSVGGRGMVNLGVNHDDLGYGGSGGVSVLWRSRFVHTSLAYQTPVWLYWPRQGPFDGVSETFPDMLRWSLYLPFERYRVKKKGRKYDFEEVFTYVSLEIWYEGWPHVRYTADTRSLPLPAAVLTSRFNGALGWQFQDPFISGLWRVGLRSRTFFANSETGDEYKQYELSLGLGVFAQKTYRFDFAIQDTYLLSYMLPANRQNLALYVSVRALWREQFSR